MNNFLPLDILNQVKLLAKIKVKPFGDGPHKPLPPKDNVMEIPLPYIKTKAIAKFTVAPFFKITAQKP